MDAAVKPRRRRKWPYLLLILVLGFAAYTWFVLHWSYSEGERVGVLQKLSRKGYVCKTPRASWPFTSSAAWPRRSGLYRA